MPLAVVGTSSGKLYFIDFSSNVNLRIIESCLLHSNSVEFLKYFKNTLEFLQKKNIIQFNHIILRFNSSGSMLFSVGNDGKIYVIDCRINEKVEAIIWGLDQRLITNFPGSEKFEKGFYLLGFLGE